MGFLSKFFNYGANMARRAVKEPIIGGLTALYYEIDAASPTVAKQKALDGIRKLIKYVEEL